MLRPDRDIERVYLCRKPVDMRKQMDGLAAIVKEVLVLDPMSGTLFVFINRQKSKLKILLWEKNGFVVWYKRLERHKFHWPQRLDVDSVAGLAHRNRQGVQRRASCLPLASVRRAAQSHNRRALRGAATLEHHADSLERDQARRRRAAGSAYYLSSMS
jgi:transposase